MELIEKKKDHGLIIGHWSLRRALTTQEVLSTAFDIAHMHGLEVRGLRLDEPWGQDDGWGHQFMPGEYIPEHRDSFLRWKEDFDMLKDVQIRGDWNGIKKLMITFTCNSSEIKIAYDQHTSQDAINSFISAFKPFFDDIENQ